MESESDLTKLIGQLCGELPIQNLGGAIPGISDSLWETYGRLSIVDQLIQLPTTLLIQAAFCWVALDRFEDDRVRTACVQGLITHRSPSVSTVLFGLLSDPDEMMREVAIEGLLITENQQLDEAAKIIHNNPSTHIQALFSKLQAGELEFLYYLDPITES